jgi:hypothetical protein
MGSSLDIESYFPHQRKADALASAEAMRSVIEHLSPALPEIIPRRDKELVKMLNSVLHVNHYPTTDTKRGRPGRWNREELLPVGAYLSSILECETSSHISLSSFIDHYLHLLDFPDDVLDALSSGDINLFEAEQLVRIKPKRLVGAKRSRDVSVVNCL